MAEIFYVDADTKNNGQFGYQDCRICVTDGDGKVLVDWKAGDKTNIEGEGFAIISALKRIDNLKIPAAEIRSDCQFWVKTINFKWRLKEPRLFPIRDAIQGLFTKTGATLLWVPRESNYAGIFLENDEAKKRKDLNPIVCPHCGKTIDRDTISR